LNALDLTAKPSRQTMRLFKEIEGLGEFWHPDRGLDTSDVRPRLQAEIVGEARTRAA